MKKKVIIISIVLILLGISAYLNYFSFYSRTRNTYINPRKVEYVTKIGHLPGRKHIDINCKNDYEKIEKIVNTINLYTDRKKVKEYDYRSNGIFLRFKMKNGDIFDFSVVINIVKLSENEFRHDVDNEKILFRCIRNNRFDYYIIKSKDLAKYMCEGDHNNN
jgi:hypothetical protein